jgi:hypothetical protein
MLLAIMVTLQVSPLGCPRRLQRRLRWGRAYNPRPSEGDETVTRDPARSVLSPLASRITE